MRTLPCFFTFLFLFSLTRTRARNPGCLRLLDEQPELFQSCRNQPCLLLKETQPTVDLGAKPHPPEGKPWRCRGRTKLYTNLKGLFFDFLNLIPELNDAYCVYVGQSCTFDDLTKVLDDTAERGLRWIAAGGLFLVKYRITPNSSPSMPFYVGKIQIIGDRSSGIEAAGNQAEALVSAFSRDSWIFVLAMFALLFLVRALLIHEFGVPINWKQACWAMLGEPYEAQKVQSENDKQSLAFYLPYWSKVFLATSAIVVLFFELAVVGFIFDPNSFVLDVRTKDLSPQQLKQFAVVANSAEEYYFRLMTGHEETFVNGTVPWVVCKDSPEVFELIRNGTARYGITHEHYGKYLLRKQGACSHFLIYNTRDLSQEYLSGWYFSRSIDLAQRSIINRNISSLRDRQRFKEEIYAVIPDEDDPCGEHPRNIYVILLVVTMGVLIFPFVLSVFCVLIHHRIVQSRRKDVYCDENTELEMPRHVD